VWDVRQEEKGDTMQGPPELKKKSRWRDSVMLKVLGIGALILLLLIPMRMVRGLIQERECRAGEVVSEIAGKWGQNQIVIGPVISIPCVEKAKDEKGKPVETTRYIHVLPETLAVSGTIRTEMRYRGLFEVVVFNAPLTLTGEFVLPDPAQLDVPERGIDWSRAALNLGLTDLKGVREAITATVQGAALAMEPGLETTDVIGSGVAARLPLSRKDRRIPFSIVLNLNGSQSLMFAPVGKRTTVSLTSPWVSPSFDGAFLPASRTVGPEGFQADWEVLHLNRSYPQVWTGPRHHVGESVFGVRLFVPADAYQKTTRTAKYAIMFFGFTFLALFVSDVANRIRVHPLQYLLVGLALVIFYTLLLSISEHLGFNRAYGLSAAATVLLVAFYSRSALRSGRLAFTVGAILTILYGYLFVLLRLEDYALLLGSIGLFIVLAVVMLVTRRINWYASERDEG
jgi:inner membrane protein